MDRWRAKQAKKQIKRDFWAMRIAQHNRPDSAKIAQARARRERMRQARLREAVA